MMIDSNNARVSLSRLSAAVVLDHTHARFLRARSSLIRIAFALLSVQAELDLILRRDATSVEAIYLSRHAAVSAAASLSAASLLDKTPRVTLKVTEPPVS